MKRKAAAVLTAILAGGIFVWTVGQNRLYAFQNRSLSAENRELSDLLAKTNQAIEEKAEQIEGLQGQIADMVLPEEEQTESGFGKKNGVYLIDTKKELCKLRDMLREGEEVEPGMPAAEASWRLRNNITLDDDMWFCLGTEERPFCGSFDGDGHSIQGRFPLMDSVTPKALFHMGEGAEIENLQICNDQSEGKIRIDLNESRECEEMESHLPGLPSCSVHAYIEEWGLDVEQTAKALRRHWEEGDRRDGYSVSLTLHSDMFKDDRKPADAEKKLQGMQEALLMLAGPEYAEMIREAMAQEGGCLWFVRLEQVGELTCCTFEVGEPAYSPIPINEQAYTPDCYPQLEKEKNDFVYYYVAVEGTWEGKEVKGQCFRIPYTFETTCSIGMTNYGIEGIDLNFDEKQDLLIHDVGYEGCWEECRALVWEEEAGQFAYFPSFPANVYRFEADRQRVVDNGNIGEWMSYVLIYEIINGEYVCTRKMVIHEYWSEYGDEVFEHYELSYYEMGELVETHPLSSDWDERELQKKTLYPDMYELMCGN